MNLLELTQLGVEAMGLMLGRDDDWVSTMSVRSRDGDVVPS
jgi:hypothetical protein